jgi:hypothetical protein
MFMSSTFAQAPVPIDQEPRHHLTFENDVVRLFDVVLPPGDVSLLHTHTRDTITVELSEDAVWSESELGERRESTSKIGRVTANTDYSENPRSHRIGNGGKTPFHELCLEMMKAPASPSKEKQEKLLEGDMARVSKVLDNRYAVAYRIRLAPGESTGRHTYRRPALMVRLPDGAFEWIEEGSDRELQNPADARTEATLVAVVFK